MNTIAVAETGSMIDLGSAPKITLAGARLQARRPSPITRLSSRSTAAAIIAPISTSLAIR
jgi:hypothetical protein